MGIQRTNDGRIAEPEEPKFRIEKEGGFWVVYVNNVALSENGWKFPTVQSAVRWLIAHYERYY